MSKIDFNKCCDRNKSLEPLLPLLFFPHKTAAEESECQLHQQEASDRLSSMADMSEIKSSEEII